MINFEGMLKLQRKFKDGNLNLAQNVYYLKLTKELLKDNIYAAERYYNKILSDLEQSTNYKEITITDDYNNDVYYVKTPNIRFKKLLRNYIEPKTSKRHDKKDLAELTPFLFFRENTVVDNIVKVSNNTISFKVRSEFNKSIYVYVYIDTSKKNIKYKIATGFSTKTYDYYDNVNFINDVVYNLEKGEIKTYRRELVNRQNKKQI